MDQPDIAIRIKEVSCFYGGNAALQNTCLDIPRHGIYAFIGPSGCGKTTLLRSVNRLNDLIRSFRLTGRVEINGEDVYAYRTAEQIRALRKNIGMIFQQPNPLPLSVIKNMLLPIKEHYANNNEYFTEKAIEKLKQAALYGEVSDRLKKTALSLSGGQQQRLCIARALMLEPEILLFDEPCSALDPIATFKIEDLLTELKENHTIIIVTHNMEQARRIADCTAFFYQGRVEEAGPTLELFSNPKTELLARYISGKF